MPRWIDGSALLTKLEDRDLYPLQYQKLREIVTDMPTVTERTAEFRNVHLSYYGDDDDTWECSSCQNAWIIEGNPKEHRYNYCPNCGAKFEKGVE